MRMNINIKTTRIELTDELMDYTYKRIEACEKLIGHDTNSAVCDVELAQTRNQRSGPIHYAEANLEVNGTLYRATAEEHSIEAALDKVKDELLRELRRSKRKKLTLVRKGGTRAKELLHQ